MSEPLELSGLLGSNLLAFLAAIGSLITLSEAEEFGSVRLDWTLSGGWRPRLWTSVPVDPEAVITTLASSLSRAGSQGAFEIATSSGELAKDLTISTAEYRLHTRKAAASGDRRLIDFANAFGSETVAVKNGNIADTGFRTMSGAGHQHFLGSMRELVACTEASHLAAALFSPWKYEDDRPSMRWDPEDDRRYALRWKDPSGDKIRTVRGANRLAIEGLRFFPVVPVDGRAVTTGFQGRGASDMTFTWPIWEVPLGADEVRSLVAAAAIQSTNRAKDESTRAALRRQGIVEVFQSRRLTLGKYRSFSPARPM